MSSTSPCRWAGFRKSLEALLIFCAAAALPPRPAQALTAPQADWLERVHVGGSAAMRLQAGARDAQLDRNNGASVHQAGLVFDIDVAPQWSFWYDVNLVREAQDRSTFREQLYLQKTKILGFDWLNAKLGRAFMPFGEEYLQWDQIANPLASNAVAFPWALDEGVVVFGDILPEGGLSYALSLQNGNGAFNFDDNPNKTLAVKLSSKPRPWLYLSASFLNLGKQGSATTAGLGEFWLSGFHISPLGATTAPSGASPSKTVSGHVYEQNAKLLFEQGEAWANFGYFHHIDGGGHPFDRYIRYYSGRLLGYVPRTEKKAYLTGRYSNIESMSSREGYRFAGTEIAIGPLPLPPASPVSTTSPYATCNYNQRALHRWSLGAGYWLHPNVLAKAEYSWEDSELIESAASAANLAFRGHRNFFVAELAARF